MAAVLACGKGAALSHRSAAELWGIADEVRAARARGLVEVSIPAPRCVRRDGIKVDRRSEMSSDSTRREGIPVTTAARTMTDLGSCLSLPQLEAAINAADRLDLISPPDLRRLIEMRKGRPGVAALRAVLDRHTFALTDSDLERRFLPIARRAGLPLPETGVRLNGFKVDFLWRELGLIVETDGLRYHRTPEQQARDRRRDRAHAAAGLTTLRFTHAEVAHEPHMVERALAEMAIQLDTRRVAQRAPRA